MGLLLHKLPYCSDDRHDQPCRRKEDLPSFGVGPPQSARLGVVQITHALPPFDRPADSSIFLGESAVMTVQR
ncbi:hypothetical protein ACWF2L_32390 [Streptomyces anulatus]